MPWPPSLPYNALICRYNEIGTKGRNRARFEEQLADSLRRSFAAMGGMNFRFEHGRLFILPHEPDTVFTDLELALVRSRAMYVNGLSSISPGFLTELSFEAINALLTQYFPEVARSYMSQTPTPVMTYSMRARRINKAFPMTCEQFERYFAEHLLKSFPQFTIDLRHAGLVVEVELRHHNAFISFERIAGPGGLPSGSGGKVLAMLSGGIDSPVACHEMMRRGCTVDFLTFHSEPYTPPAYITKVVGIVARLNTFQRRGKLVAVNLLPVQKEIRDKCRSRYRTILYRRFMMRIASDVAARFADKAIVTGDNLGQVASQTLDNMRVINAAIPDMVLRPLLTFDKLQTMAIAREIGTYELSIVDVPDSCTVFAPDDPATTSTEDSIRAEEALLDVPALINDCLQNAVIINPVTLKQHDLLKCNSNAHEPDGDESS